LLLLLLLLLLALLVLCLLPDAFLLFLALSQFLLLDALPLFLLLQPGDAHSLLLKQLLLVTERSLLGLWLTGKLAGWGKREVLRRLLLDEHVVRRPLEGRQSLYGHVDQLHLILGSGRHETLVLGP